jgi:TolB-like protein
VNRFITGAFFLLAMPLYAHETLVDGVKDLATQISATATKQAKQKIAVLPFHELEGQSTVLGSYVAEELVTNLVQLGNFNVVERQLLHKILGELKIEQSGAIDPATAKQVGKLTGVDAIVTGSITDLETFIAVNCRLIDTSTGEVFGAAKTTLTKDTDVTKLLATALSDPANNTSTTDYTPAHVVASKDVGMLRVALKSVIVMRGALRWTFEFTNRDSQQPLLVAINAEAEDAEREHGVRFVTGFEPPSIPLRAEVVDDRGGSWKLSSADVSIGFVQAGVHGRYGQESYSPAEITRLMELRDQLGRDSDDPSDTGDPEGGVNVVYGRDGVKRTSPLVRNYGNRFISGAPTTIAPAQSVTVTMTFRSDEPSPSARTFQFHAELVAGNKSRGYLLDNVTFDRVAIGGGRG